MIITVDEAKRYARIDGTEDDVEVADLIEAAEEYIEAATGKRVDNTSARAKLLCKVLVADWYENRELLVRREHSDKYRPTIASLLAQLKYAPDPEEAEE